MNIRATSRSRRFSQRPWFKYLLANATVLFLVFFTVEFMTSEQPPTSNNLRSNNKAHPASALAGISSATSAEPPPAILPPSRRLNCELLYDGKDYPIPSESYWRTMHESYLLAKDTDNDPKWDGPRMKNYKSSTGALKIPFEARQSPGKGRGLFVTDFVKKGTVVFTNDLTGRFRSGREWRKFLYLLPDNIACDVLQWAYAHHDPKLGEGPDPVEIDLNAGGLMNSGDTVGYKDNDSNTGIIVALKDLSPGDEILIMYSSFVGHQPGWKTETDTGWEEGGLLFSWELTVSS